MPRTSSHIVRRDAVPEARVISAAREWAAQLQSRCPEVVRVGCFGSYVRGDYVPGSDCDVIVELTDEATETPATIDTPGPGAQALRRDRYAPSSFPVPIEVFVYTSRELSTLRARGDAFIHAIEREVRWITPSKTAPPPR